MEKDLFSVLLATAIYNADFLPYIFLGFLLFGIVLVFRFFLCPNINQITFIYKKIYEWLTLALYF